jgi:hypothetical protein
MDGFNALQMSDFPVAARDLGIQRRRHFAGKAQLGDKSYPVAWLNIRGDEELKWWTLLL